MTRVWFHPRLSSAARTRADVRWTLCSAGLPGVGRPAGLFGTKAAGSRNPQTKFQLARFLILRTSGFVPRLSDVFGPRHRTTAGQADKPSATHLTISDRAVPAVRTFEWVFQYRGYWFWCNKFNPP